MNSTILLDFDGVIVDSIEIFSNAVNVAALQLNQAASFTSNDLRNIELMSIREICDVVGITGEQTRDFVTAIDQELYRVAFDIPVFPQMVSVIKTLSAAGRLGIVSATPRTVIAKVLKHNGLDRYFNHIVGGDMPGTKSVKIKSIVMQYQSTLGTSCMIGDTVSDIEQGKLAGVPTIAVGWGWHSMDWIRTARPDFEAHEPEDLIELTQQIRVAPRMQVNQ